MNNRYKGALGEYLAQKYLAKNGYKVVDKNCIFYGCELDIVAILPKKTQKKLIMQKNLEDKNLPLISLKEQYKNLSDMLIFVEVKYSENRDFGEPYERVNEFKQRQIAKAAEGYIKSRKITLPYRFDVISIVGDEVEHIEGAF